MSEQDVATEDPDGVDVPLEGPEHDPETAPGEDPGLPPDDTDGPADDDATGDEGTGDGAGDEDSPDEGSPAAAPPDSAAELERVSTALYKAAKNYGKRVGDILAADSLGIIPCPLCNEDFPGLLTPAPRSETAIAATRPLIGLPDLSTYREDRFARECERCQGRGKTLTGSRVPEFATMRCPECEGRGFRSAETGTPPVTAGNGFTAPPVPTHVDDVPPAAMPDASLEALKAMVAAAENAKIAQ